MCEKVEIGLWEEKYERHCQEIIACTVYCSPSMGMFSSYIGVHFVYFKDGDDYYCIENCDISQLMPFNN